LDDRIVLWVEGLAAEVEAHLGAIAADTLVDEIRRGRIPEGLTVAVVKLETGEVRIALRADDGAGATG
ncbi:MAG: hypothetical protein MUQ32_12555, partial [Chloroflexi bacterium]|nr:hypothetical protein [Chloroflexota bacterium]